MRWNKRGQLMVPKFLIATAVALMFLIPTVLIILEFTRVSDQAKDNFEALVEDIKEANLRSPPSVKPSLFIQDKKTYLYPITDQSRNAHITKDPIFGNDVDFTLSHTKECENQNCLCLCRKYKSEEDRTCQDLICEPLPDVTFSPGTALIIDRGTESFLGTGEEGPRRQTVRIIKCKAGAEYCKNSKDGDISVIFNWVDAKGVYDPIK